MTGAKPPGNLSKSDYAACMGIYESRDIAWCTTRRHWAARRSAGNIRGELVEVLPHLWPDSLPVSIVVAHRHNLSRRVRVFVEWLETILLPHLDR